MPFSDEATSALWVAPLKPSCRAQDVTHVFSSFGSIKAVRLGPAPRAAYPGQQAAEVYFATVGQAAAALTALNAIVVPALSGGQSLEIRCWVQPRAAAAAPPARGGQGQAQAGRSSPPQQAQQAQHSATAHDGPPADPSGPADAADPGVELPGITALPDALDHCRSCCYKAVPEGERGSAAKWALLQALLARGLRHESSSTFRQLPVLLTHLGDELLKARSSNPTVEAEYQGYPQAGRLRLLCCDIACQGLASISASGNGGNTHMVQLHLQCLVSAGTGQGGGAAGAAGPAGAAAAAAAAAPVPAGTHYLRSAQPSRHLVLLGVAREDVAALAARAAALGRVQKHMHNATGMLTIHFEQQAAAEALAAEAAAGTVPGLAGTWAFEFKHPVVPSGPPAKAGQPKQPAPAAGPPAATAAQSGQKGKQQQQQDKQPVEFEYSDDQPSSTVRVKKLGPRASREALHAAARQHEPGLPFAKVAFYFSTKIGYMFLSTEAAAVAAVRALRSEPPAELAGEGPLVVQFRVGTRQAAGAAGGGAAPAEPGPRCGGCGAGGGGGVTLRACSACHAVKYCSSACQLKDWNSRHASECGQLQQLGALLRAAGAAGAAAVDGDSTHLLAAALRRPDGRQAAMLRVLLGTDGSADSAGVSSTASVVQSTAAATSGASSAGDPSSSIVGGSTGGLGGTEAKAAAEAVMGTEAAAAEVTLGAEAVAAGAGADTKAVGPEPAGPEVPGDKPAQGGGASGGGSRAAGAPAAAADAASPAVAGAAGVTGGAHVAAAGLAEAAAGVGEAGTAAAAASGSATQGGGTLCGGGAGPPRAGEDASAEGAASAPPIDAQAAAAGQEDAGSEGGQLSAAAAADEEDLKEPVGGLESPLLVP